MYLAHEKGIVSSLFDETRPLLQDSLTAWELQQRDYAPRFVTTWLP